jgi:membrane protein required for beta-lactamase induction
LRGKQLASRSAFIVKRALVVFVYLLVVVGLLLVALKIEKWFLKGVGFTVLALVAAVALELVGDGLFGIRKAFDYGAYREEWEQANERRDSA